MKRREPIFPEKFRQLAPRQFEFLLIGIAGIVFFITLLSAQTIRPYTSDDVTTQTVVQSWTAGAHRDAIVGEDTYILKIPFYLLQDAIQPHNSRAKMFISVLVFNAILFIGLVIFVRSLTSKRTKLSKSSLALVYLPVIWFLALSVEPSSGNRDVLFMNPDLRNAELGIAFMLMAYLLHVTRLPRYELNSKKVAGLGLLLVGIGLFLVDDPFFTYMLGLPALGLVFCLWVSNRLSNRRGSALAGYTIAAILVAGIASKIVKALGLTTFQYVAHRFIHITELWSALANTIGSEFIQFNANISSKLINKHLILELVNCVLLGLSVWAAIKVAGRLRQRLNADWLLLAFLAVVNLAIFTVNVINNLGNNRFIILAIISQVLMLAVYGPHISNHRLRLTLIALYCLGILVNTGSSLNGMRLQITSHAPDPNAVDYKIAALVKREGLTKGYAPYWDSLINTYFASSRDIRFLPTNCKWGRFNKLDWVVNKPGFDTPAQKTFYLYSTARSDCLDPAINAHPDRTIKIDDTYTLYIYNRDIGRTMPHVLL